MPYPGWMQGQGGMGGLGGVAGQDPMRSAVAGALRRPGPAGPSGVMQGLGGASQYAPGLMSPAPQGNPYSQMAMAQASRAMPGMPAQQGGMASMLGSANQGAGQPGQFGPAPQAGAGNPWSQLAQAMPGQNMNSAQNAAMNPYQQLMGQMGSQVGQNIPGSGMDYSQLMARAAQGMQRSPQMAQGQFNSQNLGMTPAGGGASLNMGQLGQPGMQTLYGGGMNSAGGSYGR